MRLGPGNTLFLYCRVQEWVGGDGIAVSTDKKRSKWVNLDTKSQKSGFDLKVKSPKMGLSITPRHFSKRPTLLRSIWPCKGPNILEKRLKKYEK